MVNYSCEKCGKTFKQKSHYMKHLQRKTPCDNIKDKIEKIVEDKIDELVQEKLQVLVEKGDIEIKNKNLISNSTNNTVDTTEMEDTQNVFNFMEVCSGGGGLSCGLEKSGLKPILLNDIDKNSCKTLKLNHPDIEIFEGSFTDIDYSKYINKCDVLCGGVPCQSFSYAGKQKGLNDKRGDLIIKFSEMINIIQPKIFMIENVKGLLTHNKGETIQYVINDCLNKNNLYNIQYKLIKCVNYGVPQKRERVIIIGIKKEFDFNFNFPQETERIITIKEALKDVPISPGATYPEKKLKYFKKIPPGGCWINLDVEEQKEYLGKGFYSGGGKRGLLRKLSWDEPCLTILCSPAQKNTERCHPDENRPLTIRESARIQTFDDSYQFSGSLSSQYSQVGNAVPVLIGKLLGIELIKSLVSFN